MCGHVILLDMGGGGGGGKNLSLSSPFSSHLPVANPFDYFQNNPSLNCFLKGYRQPRTSTDTQHVSVTRT